MKKGKIKGILCLLSFVMAVGFMTMTASAAPATSIIVNGQDILSAENNTIQCDSGTAVYDPNEKTLTLNNADITAENAYGISFAGGDLNIILNGDSKITSGWSGIYSTERNANLTISGAGSLTIDTSANWGIRTSGNIDVAGAKLKVESQGISFGGIYANGTLSIQNSENVTASGEGYGIWGNGGISITNSTVKCYSTSEEGYYAIYSYGDISVLSGSAVTAESKYIYDDTPAVAAGGVFTISDGSSVTADAVGSNAVNNLGDIIITGENTVLEANTEAQGVPVVYSEEGDISVTDGATYRSLESSVTSLESGGNITIDNATLNVTSGQDYAAYAGGNIYIQNGAVLDISGSDGFSARNIEMNGISRDQEISLENTFLSSSRNISLTDCSLNISGDLTVEAGRDITITGSNLTVSGRGPIYATRNVTVNNSQLDVTADTNPIVANDGTLSIDGENTIVTAKGGQYTGGENVEVRSGRLDVTLTVPDSASYQQAMPAIFATDTLSISGGTVEATATGNESISKCGATANNEIIITGGITTLSGQRAVYLPGDATLSFGSESWYQWADTDRTAPILSTDTPYTYDASDSYLRIEPVGTAYTLTVEGGEGSGTYPAGTEVKISAPSYDAQQHFTGWTVTDGSSVSLADSTAASTSFFMPTENVTITANYESHTLTHYDAKEPTDTQPGWQAYDACSVCGYSTRVEIPALGTGNGTSDTAASDTSDKAAGLGVPETGDDSAPYLWLILLISAGAAVTGLWYRRRIKE